MKGLRIIGVFARLDLRKESKMKMTQQIPFNEFLSWRSQIPRQSQNNLMANQDLCQMSGLTIRKFMGGLDHIVVQISLASNSCNILQFLDCRDIIKEEMIEANLRRDFKGSFHCILFLPKLSFHF